MIRLEDFWNTSRYPVHNLSTGDRITSKEMLDNKDDIVLSFQPMTIYEYNIPYVVIGVKLGDPEDEE